MGREGCGADCQVRELEGGVRVARGVSLWVGVVVVGEDIVEGPRGRAGRDGWKAIVAGCWRVQLGSGMDVCYKRAYTLADLW